MRYLDVFTLHTYRRYTKGEIAVIHSLLAVRDVPLIYYETLEVISLSLKNLVK